MKPTSALAIYILLWTLTLFAVLPFGVRTHHEAGEDRVPGQADSAPAQPMLWRKLLWTTLISGAIFGVFYLNYVNGWVELNDLPGPSFGPPQSE